MTIYNTRTTFGGGDEPPRRKFQHFSNREASRLCRELNIPVNILDFIEDFNQEHGLDPERISAAAEAGNPIAQEVNEEIIRTKMLAMEGLIVQQSLQNLGKVQAETDQHLTLLKRNEALIARNKELEAYRESLAVAITHSQLKSSVPYIAIALLLSAFAVFVFFQNGRNTPTPHSTPVPSPVQSPKQPVDPSSGAAG
jgi:hypothetical protein